VLPCRLCPHRGPSPARHRGVQDDQSRALVTRLQPPFPRARRSRPPGQVVLPRRLVALGVAVASEDAVGQHVQALVVLSMCSIRSAASPGWAWSARLAFPLPAGRWHQLDGCSVTSGRSEPEDPQLRLRGSAAYPSTPARASSLQPARRCSLQAATRASSMAPSSPARSATTIMCLAKRAGTLKVAGNVRTISSR
jgi:hypothetical protein